jgi:hypothetical protein
MKLLPLFLCMGLTGWVHSKPVQKPLPPIYTPDLSNWKLEMTPELGGWVTEENQEIRLKIVDPKDPDPPKEDEVRFDDYGYEEGGDDAEAPPKTAAELRQERLRDEEETKRTAWRDRRLIIWLNGATTPLFVRVGHTTSYSLTPQNGENRLEILEPDSGKRLVRTWWSFASKTRLQVFRVRAADDEWGSGNLEILEPNGDLASRGHHTTSGGTLTWSDEYRHPSPPPGTYTIRWTGGYRGGKPFTVVIEAVLDGGTDTERRWRFERLMLPGAGPATLGTLDVEN